MKQLTKNSVVSKMRTPMGDGNLSKKRKKGEEEKDESTLMVDIGNLFYLKFEVFLHTIPYFFNFSA